MAFKTLIAMAVAAVGGIYLTSEEGKKARESLLKKKSIFEPIIKDLLKESTMILEGSKRINSDEIRANVELLSSEAKKILLEINLEKTVDTIKEAIKVASKKIRDASNEVPKKKIKKLGAKSNSNIVKKTKTKKTVK